MLSPSSATTRIFLPLPYPYTSLLITPQVLRQPHTHLATSITTQIRSLPHLASPLSSPTYRHHVVSKSNAAWFSTHVVCAGLSWARIIIPDHHLHLALAPTTMSLTLLKVSMTLSTKMKRLTAALARTASSACSAPPPRSAALKTG